MPNNDRLEIKIREKIDNWFGCRGDELVTCIAEFCSGNRASLSPLMQMTAELGGDVFADGKGLNDELQEDLEYRLFGLIGDYSSAPGGDPLLKAIRKDIVLRLTEIFAEAKRHWNLNNYKITESMHILDPESCVIADTRCRNKGNSAADMEDFDDPREQAQDVIDRLILFAKGKFRGPKNRKIAVNWLENPEKSSDIGWLASLAGSSRGSTKVTLSRIKRSLLEHYDLKRIDDRLILSKSGIPARRGQRAVDT